MHLRHGHRNAAVSCPPHVSSGPLPLPCCVWRSRRETEGNGRTQEKHSWRNTLRKVIIRPGTRHDRDHRTSVRSTTRGAAVRSSRRLPYVRPRSNDACPGAPLEPLAPAPSVERAARACIEPNSRSLSRAAPRTCEACALVRPAPMWRLASCAATGIPQATRAGAARREKLTGAS